jgi:hypothetical protein
VEVNSVGDIKRLVSQLDPKRNPVQQVIPVGTIMSARDENTGKDQQYQVSAPTKSKSKRDMLVEGLNVIKTRMESEVKYADTSPVEVNGKIMKPAAVGTGTLGKTWVDPLITQWLGGYRDGVHICWDLNDGFVYKYDIYEHKLTRVEKD